MGRAVRGATPIRHEFARTSCRHFQMASMVASQRSWAGRTACRQVVRVARENCCAAQPALGCVAALCAVRAAHTANTRHPTHHRQPRAVRVWLRWYGTAQGAQLRPRTSGSSHIPIHPASSPSNTSPAPAMACARYASADALRALHARTAARGSGDATTQAHTASNLVTHDACVNPMRGAWGCGGLLLSWCEGGWWGGGLVRG